MWRRMRARVGWESRGCEKGEGPLGLRPDWPHAVMRSERDWLRGFTDEAPPPSMIPSQNAAVDDCVTACVSFRLRQARFAASHLVRMLVLKRKRTASLASSASNT